MSWNSFGHLLRLTSWGESHGPAIGGVLDGVPPGVALSEVDIQPFLDRRRPGRSRHTTQRREADRVELLSGVFEGRTTGTPIAFLIRNTDQRSRDYAAIADRYRPGHADYTYDVKYGLRDPRGGGRSSARETAVRVAAGAIARRILAHVLGAPVRIRAAVVELGGLAVPEDRRDHDRAADDPLFCPDPATRVRWEDMLDAARRAGDSLGAVVEAVAEGVPAGLGAPVYGKLDADLAAAMMSINAAKAVEIGAGFAAARLRGSENADEMRRFGTGVRFLSNHAGGILGGIATGAPIVVRVAFKPTSSIRVPQRSVTRTGEEVDVVTTGRHDPCVGIRGVPVVEAMLALVLADHLLLDRAQCGRMRPVGTSPLPERPEGAEGET